MSMEKPPEAPAPHIAELEKRLQLFVDQLARDLGADVVTVYLYDAERDKFYLPVGYGLKDAATFRFAMPRSDRIVGKLVRGRKPIIGEDAKSHADIGGPFTFRERIESAAGFPILLGNRAEGVLFVNYRQLHHFSEQELAAIEQRLQEAARILAKAHLAQIRQNLTPLAPVGIMDKRLAFIVESAGRFFPNSPVALWVLDPVQGLLIMRGSTGLRREFVAAATLDLEGSNLITNVLQTQEAVFAPGLEQERAFPFPVERQHAGWKSLLAVPVWAGGRVAGVLALLSFTEQNPAPWEQELMSELAQHVGQVLREESHARILARLHEIGLALASQQDLGEVLKLIVDNAAAVFAADIVTLYLYDREGQSFGSPIARGVTQEFYAHPEPSASGIAARIVHSGEPVFCDDAEHDPRMSPGFIRAQAVKASAGFPLKVRDEVLGVLFINYRAPYKFQPSDHELIALFASQAAVAIKNAHLFQEEQQRVTLARIASTFNETLDRQRTLQAVVNGARALTGATSSSLFLFDDRSQAFELGARSPDLPAALSRSPPRPTKGLSRTMLETAQPLLIGDTTATPGVREQVIAEGTRSILGVPVQVRGERVGVLYANSDRVNHFHPRDIQLLQNLADYGAVAIERTRLLEAIASVNQATANILGLDELIQEFLGKIVSEAHFELAALQLINQERGTIETVDGINAPWSPEARHLLECDDIQCEIVRTRRTETITGWDERLDRAIYERYGHEKLARIFVPIVAEDTVLGTVEAGFDRRRVRTIPDEARARLQELVDQYAPRLGKALLPHVLQVIVDSAVRMVRADSGSIHVLRHPDQERYVYEACSGRIGPEFLQAFPPRGQGIGHQALRENRYVVHDDAKELRQSHRPIFAPEVLWEEYPEKYPPGEGIRAIACFPLVTGGKYEGVLYIHFWRPHTFSQDELSWLKVFADQVSVAIQNAQFYEKLRDRSQALLSLSTVGQSLLGRLDLESLLQEIALRACDVLQADIVTIYQYKPSQAAFVTPPTMAGSLYVRDAMVTAVRPWNASRVIVQDLQHNHYAPYAQKDAVMNHRGLGRPARKKTFVEREQIESSAGILLTAEKDIVGVMFVNYRLHRDFTDSERRLIENYATYAALAIRNARQAIQQRVEQLEAIQVIDQEISSTLDLDRVLDRIVQKSMEYVGVADGYGTLQLYDEKTAELVVRAQRNLPPEKANLRLKLDAPGITPLVARTGKPKAVFNTTREPDYAALVPGMRSELAVPLIGDDRLIGVLNLESRTPRAFNDADVQFLTLLAGQAVVAIQNAQYVQRLEQLRRGLATIASAASLRDVLEQIAESTLTVLEADDAVIYPYDPETGEFLVAQVVHRGPQETRFQPGPPRAGGVAYTVLDLGLIVVDDVTLPPPELGQRLDRQDGWLAQLDCQSFAGVLLRDARNRPLGVLYVDYRRPHRFTEAERDLIRAFADQAAIAIQNARQEAQRRRAETLAAVSTFGANFVHRVINLLGTLPPNFAKVEKAIREDDPERLSRYLDLLASDVQRVREIMAAAQKIRSLPQGSETALAVNELITQALRARTLPGNVQVECALAPDLPPLRANHDSLFNLLANLIDNALQAMPRGGDLRLGSRLTDDGRWIVVEVADTGVGMPEHVRNRIFEPFYTTRGEGLGIGLWLARWAVQEVGGDIAVTSEPQQGTTVTVHLPAARGGHGERA